MPVDLFVPVNELFCLSRPVVRASSLALCASSMSWSYYYYERKLAFPGLNGAGRLLSLALSGYRSVSLTSRESGRPSGVPPTCEPVRGKEGALVMNVWYDFLEGLFSSSNRFESLRRPAPFRL